MSAAKFIEGFSRLSHEKKVEIMASLVSNSREFIRLIEDHKHPDTEIQKLYKDFSENNLTDFHLPYGIAPNFLINEKIYHVPMVIEESSVVAAASSAAKFWFRKGGFHCQVLSTLKKGHVYFKWQGEFRNLDRFFNTMKQDLLESLAPYTDRMTKRGGGIVDINLIRNPEILPDYYQLEVSFETVDSMGANFINTCLEMLAVRWKETIETNRHFHTSERRCEIIMAILSNYTPECIVQCIVRCKAAELDKAGNTGTGLHLATRFVEAVHIAHEDTNRAVTHNKGIFNGIDAVVMATGNDFRAVEANGHAYAVRDGKYRGLSKAWIEGDQFNFLLELPLAIGTVGGLTTAHPLAAGSLEILGNPDAEELMKIIAAVGLANNYNAVRSLITTGIQKGHMKLHLSNILHQLNVNQEEKLLIIAHFSDRVVSYSSVKEYLESIRKK